MPTFPKVIPRSEHVISRANISGNALKVLYRLHQAGYEAYLVGGGVRDLLLGREPKDFDVATDARPEQVKELFRNCRLIGRRFRLAHVHFGGEIIEVATFRAQHAGEEDEGEALMRDGMILRDNVYGTLEDDAWRRDFTINALYYNIGDFSVVDYTGGLDDLKSGTLRLIGDPEARFREDPVRLLRAARFLAKLGFRLDAQTEDWVRELGELLSHVPPARLFDECLKLFLGGHAVQSYEMLRHYHLFEHLFPLTDDSLGREQDGHPQTLILQALANTDARIEAGKPVTPAFLFAALLWPAVREEAQRLAGLEDMTEVQALQVAGNEIASRQVERVTIPKRFSLPMREIWTLQARLPQRAGKRAARLYAHPRFRAAYDFLLLRHEAGEGELAELCEWWTRYQETDEAGRAELQRPQASTGRRRRRRRGGARKRSSTAEE